MLVELIPPSDAIPLQILKSNQLNHVKSLIAPFGILTEVQGVDVSSGRGDPKPVQHTERWSWGIVMVWWQWAGWLMCIIYDDCLVIIWWFFKDVRWVVYDISWFTVNQVYHVVFDDWCWNFWPKDMWVSLSKLHKTAVQRCARPCLLG